MVKTEVSSKFTMIAGKEYASFSERFRVLQVEVVGNGDLLIEYTKKAEQIDPYKTFIATCSDESCNHDHFPDYTKKMP